MVFPDTSLTVERRETCQIESSICVTRKQVHKKQSKYVLTANIPSSVIGTSAVHDIFTLVYIALKEFFNPKYLYFFIKCFILCN